MSQIRLVYRNFLLPPLPLPINTLTQYLQVTSNFSILQIRHKLKSKQENELQALRKQKKQLNLAIANKIIEFKQTYIQPLSKCPFFFEYLEQYGSRSVDWNFQNIDSEQNVINYLSNFKLKKKMDIMSKFKKDFQKYEIPAEIAKEIVNIPWFLNKGPEEMATSDNKLWRNLTSQQQKEYQRKYLKKLGLYNEEIKKICVNQKIEMKDLFESLNQQMLLQKYPSLYKILFS